MKQRGFIQILAFLIIVFIIMSLLGVSFGKVFSNKTLGENWEFIKNKIAFLYNTYLKSPISKVISSIFDYIKNLLKEQVIKGVKAL